MFFEALSFFVSLAVTLALTREKRSLVFFFALLLILYVLFDLWSVPGFFLGIGYRLWQPERKESRPERRESGKPRKQKKAASKKRA